jgi:hypothetical protein
MLWYLFRWNFYSAKRTTSILSTKRTTSILSTKKVETILNNLSTKTINLHTKHLTTILMVQNLPLIFDKYPAVATPLSENPLFALYPKHLRCNLHLHNICSKLHINNISLPATPKSVSSFRSGLLKKCINRFFPLALYNVGHKYRNTFYSPTYLHT